MSATACSLFRTFTVFGRRPWNLFATSAMAFSQHSAVSPVHAWLPHLFADEWQCCKGKETGHRQEDDLAVRAWRNHRTMLNCGSGHSIPGSPVL